MATYEYVCLTCERPFEERRPMAAGPGDNTGHAAVDTALACPSCGSDRVRRRFSVFATTGGAPSAPSAGAGCACGGACACGH